jgi:hypothetical protein
MHLHILCEGVLEKRVLERFLQPFWEKRFETCEVQNYSGNGELKQKFKGDAETQLSTEPDSCVVCLVDLYQEPFGVYDKTIMNTSQGFDVVQKYMYGQIQERFHPQFGAFPVVMELETWLLADEVIQKHLAIPTVIQPELIPHPAAYLENIYRQKNNQYGKIISGSELFRKSDSTGALRVYKDTCPHFNLLADWIINPTPVVPSVASQKYLDWQQKCNEKYSAFEKLNTALEITDELFEMIDKSWVEYETLLRNPPE